jgi:hypothetical protein
MYTATASNGNRAREIAVSDKWLKRLAYPLISLLAIHIGNENSFFQLLQNGSYYTDMLLAFTCTYGAGWYLKQLYGRMSRRHPWHAGLRRIMIRGLVYGLLMPLLAIMAAELLYLVLLLNIPAAEWSLFYLEIPLAAIFLLLLNIVYLFLYTRTHFQALHHTQNNAVAANAVFKEQWLVFRGAQAINIAAEAIAFFIILEKTTFLVTRCNEKYLYNERIQTIAEMTDPNRFFMLNRQVLAAKTAVQCFDQTETRKLAVTLTPAASEAIYVSKARSGDFIKWLEAR